MIEYEAEDTVDNHDNAHPQEYSGIPPYRSSRWRHRIVRKVVLIWQKLELRTKNPKPFFAFSEWVLIVELEPKSMLAHSVYRVNSLSNVRLSLMKRSYLGAQFKLTSSLISPNISSLDLPTFSWFFWWNGNCNCFIFFAHNSRSTSKIHHDCCTAPAFKVSM